MLKRRQQRVRTPAAAPSDSNAKLPADTELKDAAGKAPATATWPRAIQAHDHREPLVMSRRLTQKLV